MRIRGLTKEEVLSTIAKKVSDFAKDKDKTFTVSVRFSDNYINRELVIVVETEHK